MMEDIEESVNLHGSMDPALLPDITTTYEHMQRSDGTVGLVEKANSGRMSPIRKRSVKDVEQQIESLEKENFDLKLRIYFLEQQKGINKDDTLKVNIDLRVQLQSIHQEFQKKQYTWEQMMAGYENHIQELEEQINKSMTMESAKEAQLLKQRLAEKEQSLHEMEQLLHEKAFESQTQLQATHSEIAKLRDQLADRERQLITSPSQEELLAVKRSRDEKESELKDKADLVQKLTQESNEQKAQLRELLAQETRVRQALSERELEIGEKDAELGAKEQEVRALRDELTQKDFALRKSQIDLQALHTSFTGREAELERYKAEIAEKFNEETKSTLTDLETARRNISLQDAKISSKDTELLSCNKKLEEQEKTLNDLNNILHQQKQQIKALGDSVSELRFAVQEKSREVEEITSKSQLSEKKFSKDLANLECQLTNCQRALTNKSSELESLRQQAEQDQARLIDVLNEAKAALDEKDRTISSLAERGVEKDRRLTELEQQLDQPEHTSTPRDDQRTAINHLCSEIALLKKENAALKEGRPMEYMDDDVDLDAMSENSETRDFLHSELAKNSAKAQALQAKLLELSREDVDGGSESSSILREQVSALMRMRESDKKVIDALKKHISLNHGGAFDPDVLTNMAAEVCRLSAKIKELHKSGQRSNRSQQSSRSQRSGASSSTSSVYKEEINHLRRELDLTRHEASKNKTELHKLSNESAVVSKLQSTEALVRQQAEEKRRLLEQLAYYKSLLRAAGLLPPSPPVSRGHSLTNLSANEDSSLPEKRISRIPRRSSSTPRLDNHEPSMKQSRDESPDPSNRDGQLQEHVQGVKFRQQYFTPDKVHGALQRMSDRRSGGSNSNAARDNQSETPAQDLHNSESEENRLQAALDEYRAEMEMFGRPMELKQKLDLLSIDLNNTQEQLNASLECNQELEHSYQMKLEEKDEIIDDLEEKIRQLEALLRAGFGGGNMSGGGLGDQSTSSITLELAGSRPPSSLHSVPVERTSSRVVSLSDPTAPHDGSTSGIAMDRSALSFSGSAAGLGRPSSGSPRDMSKTFDSLLSRSGDSHTATHSAATVVDEDAVVRQSQRPLQSQMNPSSRNEDGLSLDVLDKVTAVRGDSGFGTSRRTKDGVRDLSGSVVSLTETLDGTTERLRRDPSAAHQRYNEPPSLGGSLLPAAEIFPSQENLLNTSSSEVEEKLVVESHARRFFSTDSATSPEKGRVHSPAVSIGNVAGLTSPVKSSEFDQTVERYEKQTSPNRQLLDRPQADSWEQAANHVFGSQTPSPTSHLVSQSTERSPGGIISERPLSSASTQTDSEDMVELKERLVQALNREDTLKDQRGHLAQLQREFDLTVKSRDEENEELRSKLAAADADIDDHIQKRMATVEIANELRQQLTEKTGALEQISEQYEEELRSSQGRLSAMSEHLAASQNELNKLSDEVSGYKAELSNTRKVLDDTTQQLSGYKAELSDTRKELESATQQLSGYKADLSNTRKERDGATQQLSGYKADLSNTRKELDGATQQLIDSGRRYRETAQQLSEQKQQLKATREQLDRANQMLIDSSKHRQETVSALPRSSSLPRPRTGGAHQVESTLSRADSAHQVEQLPRPRDVRALQAEITSILDTSEHIKSNIASALEHSRLDDTRIDSTADIAADTKLIELLKLNLTRVERLNERIGQLLIVEEEALRNALRPPASSPLLQGNETRLLIDAAEFQPSNAGRLNKSENNAVDQSNLNSVTLPGPQGRNSNLGASELTFVNGGIYQQPAGARQQPADIYQPSGVRQQPADIYHQTAGGRQQPADMYNQTAGGRQQPVDTYHQTAGGRQQPADIYNQTAGGHQQPADIYHQTAGGRQQPAGIYQQPADAYRQPPAAGDRNRPSSSAIQHQPSGLIRPGFSQSDDPRYRPRSAGIDSRNTYAPSGSAYLPTQADVVTSSAMPADNRPAYLLYRSDHPDSLAPPSVQTTPHHSTSPDHPGVSLQASHQSFSAGGADMRSPNHPSHSPYKPDHLSYGTQAPHSPYSPGYLASTSQTPANTSHSPYNAEHPSYVTRAPAQTSHPSYSPGHPGYVAQAPALSSYSPNNPDHPSYATQTPAHASHSLYSSGNPDHTVQAPVHTSTSTLNPSARTYRTPADTHMMESSLYAPGSMSPERGEGKEFSHRPHQLTFSEANDGSRPAERRYQDNYPARETRLPAIDDLPSTRNPLYAISDLINYELLKKQNEESLVLLSGIEARVQGRLDSFTSSSPLDDVEWCTLKDLKSCADNLKRTLFAEKKHITQFYIRELPDTRSAQYEEVLRAYKKLEGRYDWAKAQLTELMKVTKLDSDLVAQMKRVKAVLKASKENMKGRTCTQELLRRPL